MPARSGRPQMLDTLFKGDVAAERLCCRRPLTRIPSQRKRFWCFSRDDFHVLFISGVCVKCVTFCENGSSVFA